MVGSYMNQDYRFNFKTLQAYSGATDSKDLKLKYHPLQIIQRRYGMKLVALRSARSGEDVCAGVCEEELPRLGVSAGHSLTRIGLGK